MTTIAHLSDLHFGTEKPDVARRLVEELKARPPTLTVVSGDLTQRARRAQFRSARDYLAQLPGPKLVVPGNHDIPLYDVLRRFLAPLGRFRRIIGADVNPIYEDDSVLVLGLNTARSFTWQDGRISVEQIEVLGRRLQSAGPRLKVVVTHHPFVPPPNDAGIQLVGRAALAVPLLEQHKVDLLLAGHLHVAYAADIRTQYPGAHRSIIVAQAGTAISGRVRGEPNAYNWITLEPASIRVEARVWNGSRFGPGKAAAYERTAEGWLPAAGAAA